MRAARKAAYALAVGLLLGLASAAGAVDWGECGAADRAALLESALLWEVRAVVWYANAPVACVVVGVAAFDMEEAVDPPASVVLRVAKVSQRRVVSVSKAAECPGALKTFVGEPKCAGLRGIVATRLNDHCPLEFKKIGKRWVEATNNVCA